MGTGDIIATMMAWLNTPKKGGGTGFIYSNREMLLGKMKETFGIIFRGARYVTDLIGDCHKHNFSTQTKVSFLIF